MKNFRQKAVPAVAMLAVASLSLASVTYAWFTSNKKVEASEIDINVATTAGGIAIAKTADGSYTNSIKFTHDKSATDSTQVGDFASTEVKPLSTNGVLDTNGNLVFYEGIVNPSTPSNIESATLQTSGYLTVDLYFENQNANAQKVYFDYADVNDMFSSLELSTEALRLGFVNKGYVTTKPTAAEVTAGVDWQNGQKSVAQVGEEGQDGYVAAVKKSALIIEPNAKAHLAQYGTNFNNKEDYYGISKDFTSANAQEIKPSADTDYVQKVTTSEVSEHNGIVASAAAVNYVAGDKVYVKADFDEGTNHITQAEDWSKVNDTTYTKQHTLDANDTAVIGQVKTPAVTGTKELFTLPGNAGGSTYSWIRVYVWLEGNDIDCLSTISNLDFKLVFKFICDPQSAAL